MAAFMESNIPGLELSRRGKVRDVYDLGTELLIVATDRMSAYDVVLPTGIPDKGRILTQVSNQWFHILSGVVENHLTRRELSEVVTDPELLADLEGRSVIVKKTEPLKIEAIVRGYITGSGWRDYQKSGRVCGMDLPRGLKESERLPGPIFTPSTKAEQGDHDENISFKKACDIVGQDLAEEVRDVSLELYQYGAERAEERGIILADTKFEFGIQDGRLILIDEVLTPDSSRFWDKETYKVGESQPSFDKQFVRDYLETLDWDKTPPGPELPDEIVEQTAAKYREALERLTK